MTSMSRHAWQRFVAAERKYSAAAARLREKGCDQVIRSALSTGEEFRAAIVFLADRRPRRFLSDNLDLLLPLAVQGGWEQGIVRDLLGLVDPATLRSALPGLVDRVVDGPGDRYLELLGLMTLLKSLGEAALLHRVTRTALASDDPDVREAAEDFQDTRSSAGVAAGGGHASAGGGTCGSAATSGDGHRTGVWAARRDDSTPAPRDVRRAWSEFVRAWRDLGAARRGLMDTDFAREASTGLTRDDERPVVVRLLVYLFSSSDPPGPTIVRSILWGVDESLRDTVLDLLTDEIVNDPLNQQRAFVELLPLLLGFGHETALARAVAYGARSTNAEIRAAARAVGGGSATEAKAG